MEKTNTDKKILKKYGITMGCCLLVIAVFLFSKNGYSALKVAVAALAFFALGLGFPFLLRPIYIVWMRFAHILGWVNTRLLLVVIFYVIFSPIGLLMRLFSIDLLDRKIDKQKTTYWKKKEVDVTDDYSRQF